MSTRPTPRPWRHRGPDVSDRVRRDRARSGPRRREGVVGGAAARSGV